jgi:hypothetical protein
MAIMKPKYLASITFERLRTFLSPFFCAIAPPVRRALRLPD